MRGILSFGTYLPFRRLDRTEITSTMGSGGGRGTRTVASYDEDTTTMAVEAARTCLAATDVAPASTYFSTVDPAYFDRTNASTIHAALRFDPSVSAVDMNGSQRSAVGALQAALEGSRPTLVVGSDIRIGLPTSADEAAGGDAASALLVGSDDDGPVLAEYLGGAVATGEFVDRWREPGESRSKLWEEKFGEVAYAPLAAQAWAKACEATGIDAAGVTSLIVTGLHARAIKRTAAKFGVDNIVDDLGSSVGNSGAAHPGLLLASVLESASAGDVVGLAVYADGVQVMFFRVTEHVGNFTPARSLATQLANGAPVSYPKFLSWRGTLTVEPPRRPLPDRPSSSAALRNIDWKFGLINPNDDGGTPMANAVGTVTTFTIDKLVYSPSPPVVFGVVDFDNGVRMPVEIADVDAADVAVGDRVEMTFRRLYDGDGIVNYHWKARPVRD